MDQRYIYMCKIFQQQVKYTKYVDDFVIKQ